MCLAVPGRIEKILDESPLRQAIVDFGGVSKVICLAYTPDARVGDHVLVHVGFAITTLDEQAAAETLRYLNELEQSEFGT